tara:strand:+ start:3012 stop:3302 length:291 start_codon:yes stop_codon:yes gene_type:complete
MLTGEVRKVLNSDYTDRKSGQVIRQCVLVLEPTNKRQNYEIYLNNKQILGGAATKYEKMKGQTVTVEVSLYVNHQHNFHKFSAVGDALPKGASSNV